MSCKKILIIDDEKNFTSVLKINLEALGKYEIGVENDPMQALASAIRFKPDLILLDIIMPNKEGPDVAIEIKSHPILRDIPIVFLTATITPEEADCQHGIIGGRSFVAKPSTLGHLISSIERHLISVD